MLGENFKIDNASWSRFPLKASRQAHAASYAVGRPRLRGLRASLEGALGPVAEGDAALAEVVAMAMVPLSEPRGVPGQMEPRSSSTWPSDPWPSSPHSTRPIERCRGGHCSLR